LRRIALLMAPAFLALALMATPQTASAQSADEILKSMPGDMQKVVKSVDRSQRKKMAKFCADKEKMSKFIDRRSVSMAQAQEVSAGIRADFDANRDKLDNYYAAKCDAS